MRASDDLQYSLFSFTEIAVGETVKRFNGERTDFKINAITDR